MVLLGSALDSPIPCTRKVSAASSSFFKKVKKTVTSLYILTRLYGCRGSDYRVPRPIFGILPLSSFDALNFSISRLGLSCIAMFLEFCVYEPRLMIDMSGTDWIVRVLTGNSGVNKGIANLVCRVLVHWLDDPAVRNMAQLHLVLEQIFAPLIEFGFFEKSYTSSERFALLQIQK